MLVTDYNMVNVWDWQPDYKRCCSGIMNDVNNQLTLIGESYVYNNIQTHVHIFCKGQNLERIKCTKKEERTIWSWGNSLKSKLLINIGGHVRLKPVPPISRLGIMCHVRPTCRSFHRLNLLCPNDVFNGINVFSVLILIVHYYYLWAIVRQNEGILIEHQGSYI